MDASAPKPGQLLRARVRMPEHVVYRDFGNETVILNLDTGMYHGLNATAAAMIEALNGAPTVDDAVDRLTGEFGQPREVIEGDVLDLCVSLIGRGLVEADGGGA